jgi:hypothetical protein
VYSVLKGPNCLVRPVAAEDKALAFEGSEKGNFGASSVGRYFFFVKFVRITLKRV